MTERRFTEDEVAQIFERATEAQQSGRQLPASGDGMTLAEVQAIGREVGIPADLIRDVAQQIDTTPRRAGPTVLGMPLGVERTIELGRRLSEEEWERFVVDLRETFDARGTVRQEGSLRSWSNGNLQALLEPTASGHRIRLRTRKGDARALIGMGATMIGFSATALIAATLKGALSDVGFLAAIGTVAAMGAVMFGSTALRLPAWARTREQQMDELAARLAQSAETPAV